jgi:hypothetical protein
MSEKTNFGFANLVPGFDFLQNLTKGAAQNVPQLPNLSNWVAPTLNVDELEKRIGELKAVHFWLDQNSKALGATIQALEVQKMTLATLQGMNFNMGEVADALRLKTSEAVAGGVQKASEMADAARRKVSGKPAGKEAGQAGGGNGAAPFDPLQWWGALTQQFQQIAAGAMKDVGQKAPVAQAAPPATAKAAAPAPVPAPAAKKKGTARKAAPRKRSAKA